MSSRIVLTAPSANSQQATLHADGDFTSFAQIRRRLLQAAISVEEETEAVSDVEMPLAKLHLLRGFLTSIGATDTGKARRLLLMALLQLEDEADARRFLAPHPVLPVIAGMA